MTDNFVKLKDEIKHLYSEEVISDAELNQMAKDLIKFFAIAATITHEQSKEDNHNINNKTKKENK